MLSNWRINEKIATEICKQGNVTFWEETAVVVDAEATYALVNWHDGLARELEQDEVVNDV